MSREPQNDNERTLITGIGLVVTCAIFLVCMFRQVSLTTAFTRAIVSGFLCAAAARILSRVIVAMSPEEE